MKQAVIFEEHSSVLAHWFARGVRAATLIYLDAHLDLQFIDPARIARLAACSDSAALAALASPHCLSPDRSYCYGIEDFLYPAARLGMLRRVVWVAPPHVLEAGMSAALGSLLQMEGVTIEDLESFHADAGGALHGRLLGVALTICELRHVPALALGRERDGPLLVDIDADYFVTVPGDRVWAEPRAVVAALKDLLGEDAGVTIARSVGSGFLPLRHRFLADHLAALWEGRLEDACHWQRLLDIERLPTGGRDAACAALLEQRPACAASLHACALATADPARRTALFALAAGFDAAYADDPVRLLGEFRARRLQVDLARVTALQREVETAGLEAARQETAWVALGSLYAAFGQLEQAQACDARAGQGGPGHPELALELGKLHMARGGYAQALPFLARAAADDETRVGAWLHLAECAHAMGDHRAAGEWGLRGHAAASAWPLLPQRLAVYAHAGGDTLQAAEWLARHAELERQVRQLAARLG